MTPQGLQPADPAVLRSQLIALVAGTVPDYTANLPGSLIEDISSTDTFALVVSDSFLVDLVNSVTPYGANAFLLAQLGVLYGIDHQPITNTSVFLVFTGPPGYVIPQGFAVSDGTYQYITQDGGICGLDGNSLPIYAISNTPGAWPVLANSVNELATSTPSNINLLVTNPVSGIPSFSGEPISIWRERCFTAGLAASTGMGRYLKTLLANVPGVINRLVSVRQEGSNYVIMVGGGDPYQVANAIWQADFYTPGLAGATIEVDNVANTNPMQVTTVNNHNLADGDVEMLTGVDGMKPANWQPLPITVTGFKTFTMPLDATVWGHYNGGGIVTPNPINNVVTITDYPDAFAIPYVIPPQELVNMTVTWRTNSPNFVSPNAMAQAAVPAIVDYINSLPVGSSPINLNVLRTVFLDATVDVLQGEFIIDLEFVIYINGIGFNPQPGTNCIFGDPNSYFYTENGRITVTEGL